MSFKRALDELNAMLDVVKNVEHPHAFLAGLPAEEKAAFDELLDACHQYTMVVEDDFPDEGSES